MTNMKSGIFNSENLYVKHFQIAETNYNLLLMEERMAKLTKELFEGKRKVNGKVEIAQKINIQEKV